jgi:hypothetical protein
MAEISDKKLASYPEEGPPVVVDYHKLTSNMNPESTSVYDIEVEDGTTEGPCPFIVHGLTGEEFSTKTMKIIKAMHLDIGQVREKYMPLDMQKHPN